MTAGANKVSTKRVRSRTRCACRRIAACHPTCKNGIVTSCLRAHQAFSFLPLDPVVLLTLSKGSSQATRDASYWWNPLREGLPAVVNANDEFYCLDECIPQSLRWVPFASQRPAVLLMHKIPRPSLKCTPLLTQRLNHTCSVRVAHCWRQSLLRSSVTTARAHMVARKTCLRPHDEARSSTNREAFATRHVYMVTHTVKTAASSVCQMDSGDESRQQLSLKMGP